MIAGRSAGLLCLLVGLVAAAQAGDASTASSPGARAANDQATKAATPAAEDEFLEFLGSIDADWGDEDWIDYLSRTDIEKVAKAKRASPSMIEVQKR